MDEICKSVEATIEAGKRFAVTLVRGDIVNLQGDLGAGKTHFVKGVALGLGVEDIVSSPTFTVIHEYEAKAFPLYHIDFYRLESAEEAMALGLEECFHEGVTLVEWGSKFSGLLPATAKEVRFEILSDSARRICMVGNS